jgi:hypothetical protein
MMMYPSMKMGASHHLEKESRLDEYQEDRGGSGASLGCINHDHSVFPKAGAFSLMLLLSLKIWQQQKDDELTLSKNLTKSRLSFS